MNISKISTNQAESYIPRELKVESTRQNTAKSDTDNKQKLNNWQEQILLNAIDKLANNIQVDNSHPLGRPENSPLESYDEAMQLLSEINSESLRNFGSKAQANVSPESFMRLLIEQ